MSFKLKEDHLIEIVEFMEMYPDFATGRLSVVNARDKFKSLWKELTNKLNSLGFGVRPVEKWQKTWTDYKTNLKKKAAEIKRHEEATGGGPKIKKKLTDIELRVLAILGKTFFEGCGVRELGLLSPPVDNNSVIMPAEVLPSTSNDVQTVSKPVMQHTSKRPVESNEYVTDHDYLVFAPNKTPSKRQKHDDMTSIYKDTINYLEKINQTVETGLKNVESSIASKIDGLRDTVAKGFEAINQTLQEFLHRQDIK